MKTRAFGVLCAAAFYLIMANGCFAREVLFYKVSRNYDSEGQMGKVYRQELEKRMFKHSTWRQRLYYNPYEPDIDETLEVYSKVDGSRWLSYRRATPSLSRFISDRIWLGEQFDLKKKLDGVSITGQELALPVDVAKEIELLWRAMLPGLPKDPDPEERVIVPHAPAFAREGDSVKTGRIAMAAYNTPAYRAFMGIVDDLIRVCDRGGNATDPILARLPDKVRRLRTQLQE
jgi:hypothetical protein